MPRLPVDGKKVIEYRVTLGAKERELFQDAQWSYTFGKVGATVSGILGNPVILLGIAGYIAYKLDQILDPDWRNIVEEMTPDQLRDWLETQNLVGAGIGGLLGLIVGGPLGGIFGSILGSAAVEVGEGAYAAVDEASDEMFEGIDATLNPVNGVLGLMWFMRTLEELGTALQPGSHEDNGGGGGGAF
jgi:hypothetical protein